MKLSTRKDVEAPVAAVWAVLADFDHWERGAMRRGVEVLRSEPGPAWSVGFVWRGRPRRVELAVAGLEPDHRLDLTGRGAAFEGKLGVELVEMAPRRTRMIVGLEIRPLTLAARLIVQSLKLARSRVQDRFETRVAQFAAEAEARAAPQRVQHWR